MDLVEFEAPASRAALMDRFFEDSWEINENREWFVMSGWLKGRRVRVEFRGLKGDLPAVVLAFLGGLASLPDR